VTSQIELVLFAVYPIPFSFVIGFFLSKLNIRLLAVYGGEEWFPDRVVQVVEKYRDENNVDPDLDTEMQSDQ
jgi:hypothetical protein